MPKPELPNPAAQQAHFIAAPRDFHAAAPDTEPCRAVEEFMSESADERQLEAGDIFLIGDRPIGIFDQRKRGVFRKGHRTPERTALKKHSIFA